ncbi:hypothetical protein AZL_023930 [Azospirillum sp. B510]|uniref:lipase family protein n=1 Tax=Azospirillum sp. (strain B510) TaxID=137722 RepID=UPI0001C4C9A0|nr:lipase family protein [Azospirillum sp. B510]BAI73031.1 hypothetical protein AZL_023930 [Azospirillum sp. B510]
MALPPFGAAYDAAEALEIMQIAAAVDSFVPLNVPSGAVALLDPTLPASGAPFDSATQQNLPSLFYDRWPSDWCAAGSGTWGNWIVNSSLGNQALFAGLVNQSEIPTYCVAFRGTMTGLNAVEDFIALPITAQEIPPGSMQSLIPADIWNNLPADVQSLLNDFSSKRSYVDASNIQVAQNALVHLGFRMSLESLDNALEEKVVEYETKKILWKEVTIPVINSLYGRLSKILGEVVANSNAAHNTATLNPVTGLPQVNIYVTGHSLGAGMAALYAAWLATQPFSNCTINVKCYAFAQPKPGNDYFSYATNILCQQQGALFGEQSLGFYAVLNSLDTVPQVPVTLQTTSDLNYWSSIEQIAELAGDTVGYQKVTNYVLSFLSDLNLPSNLNYMHVGTPVILNGTPVTAASPQTPADTYTFPMNGESQVPFPAYLVQQGSAPENAPATGTVPQPWNINIPTSSSLYVNTTYSLLWQHMPWTYEQLLIEALPVPT